MCSYSLIRESTVKTRKDHECAWCAEVVLKGSVVPYRAYTFEGDFISDWMHPECAAAMGKLGHDDLCDGWLPGDFQRGSTEWN